MYIVERELLPSMYVCISVDLQRVPICPERADGQAKMDEVKHLVGSMAKSFSKYTVELRRSLPGE